MVLCVSAFCPSVSELSFLSFVSLYVPSDGCSHVGEVVVFDLEANLFFTVLSLVVKSIFLDLEARVFVSLIADALM